MQPSLFPAPKIDTSRGGAILRPRDPARPIRMVLGTDEAGRYVVAECSHVGVVDKSTAVVASPELQAWIERPAPELPGWL